MGLFDLLGGAAQGHLAGQEALRQQAAQRYNTLRQVGADQVKARSYGAAMGMQGALYDALNKATGTNLSGPAFNGNADNPQTRRAVAGMYGVDLPGPSLQKVGRTIGQYDPEGGSFKALYTEPDPQAEYRQQMLDLRRDALAQSAADRAASRAQSAQFHADSVANRRGRGDSPLEIEADLVALADKLAGPAAADDFDGSKRQSRFNSILAGLRGRFGGSPAPAPTKAPGAAPSPRKAPARAAAPFAMGPVSPSVGNQGLAPYLPAVKKPPQAAAMGGKTKYQATAAKFGL